MNNPSPDSPDSFDVAVAKLTTAARASGEGEERTRVLGLLRAFDLTRLTTAGLVAFRKLVIDVHTGMPAPKVTS